MVITFSIILLIISLIGYKIENNITNPITVFSGLWGVVLLCSHLSLYTLQEATEDTYKYFFAGVIMFVIGFYVNKIFLNKCRIVFKKRDRQVGFVLRYNIMYLLIIVCILFLLLNLINLINQTGSLNLRIVQSALQSGDYDNDTSPFLNAIQILVITPVSFALPAIAAADFWFGKKDFKLLLGTVVLCFVNMLATANRTTFMLVIIYLIIGAYIKIHLYNNDFLTVYQKNKMKKWIKYLCFLGFFAFLIMTISRGSSIFRNVYTNLAMSPRMFEIWSKEIDAQNVYGYGVASLLGFFYPVCYVIKNIFGTSSLPDIVQSMYDWNILTDKQWVWPGDKITANAYVSIFWFFYTDARIIGIMLGSFIFGIVTSRSYLKTVSEDCDSKSVACYCMIFYAILFSFVRFQFALSKYVLSLLFILIFAYKKCFVKEEI